MLPLHTLKTMYNSLIVPHFYYCILLWGFDTTRLIKLQKKAIRVITCSKFNAHTEPLMKSLNLLKLDDIFFLQSLRFFYKYNKNQLPSYFNNMFIENAAIHSYNTRNQSALVIPYSRTSTARNSIRFKIPNIIRMTDESIISKMNTHSLNGFSGFTKRYLINNYSSECSLVECYICNR